MAAAIRSYHSRKSEEKEFNQLFSDLVDYFQSTCNIPAWKVNEETIFLYSIIEKRPWVTDPNFSGIGVSKLARRCAYVKRYSALYCGLTRMASEIFLQDVRPTILQALLSRNKLSVISINGGAGADVIGFCSALKNRTPLFKSMDLTMVDKRPWESMFLRSTSLALGSSGLWLKDVDVKAKFIETPRIFELNSKGIEDADVLLMVKVLSIWPEIRQTEALEKIFGAMRTGAVFLFIDEDSEPVLETALPCYMKVLLHSATREFRLNNCGQGQSIRTNYEICALQKSLRIMDPLVRVLIEEGASPYQDFVDRVENAFNKLVVK